MKVNKAPCVNCICLAICKTHYHSIYDKKSKDQYTSYNARIYLQLRCSILHSHFNNKTTVYINTIEDQLVQNFHIFMQKVLR